MIDSIMHIVDQYKKRPMHWSMHIVVLEICNIHVHVIFISFVTLCMYVYMYFEYILVVIASLTSLLYTGGVK